MNKVRKFSVLWTKKLLKAERIFFNAYSHLQLCRKYEYFIP